MKPTESPIVQIASHCSTAANAWTIDRPLDKAGARAAVRAAFAQLQDVALTSEAHGRVRDQLVKLNTPLVRYLVRRFARSGEPIEDLVQVGMIGLLKAIDRFDPDRGLEFSSFAAPTILGEIKRYFRDSTWAVHVPRGARDLHSSVMAARTELDQVLGRSPTVEEIAEHLGADASRVVEALEAANAYRTTAIDAVTSDTDRSGRRYEARLACTERGLDQVERWADLRPALATLPARKREILALRFVQDQTQTEIAKALGVSQMQICRLLASALDQLRDVLTEAPSECLDAVAV
ncbi:MAG: SigB/SigF/SigG family RNA polymerase sigma factor [Jatrophihabitantaceae bacterium]